MNIMTGALRYVCRREDVLARVAIAGITVVCWAYLFWMERAMYGPNADCPMHATPVWTLDYFVMTLLMWSIMMIAMMLPSAAPMVLTVNTIAKSRLRTLALPLLFVTGYLVVWTGFSLAATVLQWFLHRAALLSVASLTVTPVLGGVLLISAGAYQWTPYKRMCLVRCSPLAFLATEWRDGVAGAFVMGLRHGVFCTGCCAVLMLLLFVAGVMNLLWIAVLAATVLIEKLFSTRERISRILGALLVAAGIGLTIEGVWWS
jgi:predicted metal-binding membrane protein